MSALYNEIDPFAAHWLRNLIAAGHLPPGKVDEQSIADLREAPATFHTFAGVGGWPLALRLAGWPDDVPVWTGSCPCQPFSQAGRGKGTEDERHLWPEWFRLIEQHRPAIVFGEQVASPAALQWWDAVCGDLEGAGYSARAVDLCAASVGAPHIRQRLYWVAVARGERLDRLRLQLREWQSPARVSEASGRSEARGLAVACDHERDARRASKAHGDRPQQLAGRGVSAVGLGHAERERGGRHAGSVRGAQASVGRGVRRDADRTEPASANAYADLEWLSCSDGRSRPTKPGLQPLAYGVPARVGRLRAYGNAICVPLAAEFVRAVIDALAEEAPDA